MNNLFNIFLIILFIGCGQSRYDELNEAVENGNLEKIEKSVSKLPYYKETGVVLDELLLTAIKAEQSEVVQLLIDKGANIHNKVINDFIKEANNIKIVKIFCDMGNETACFKIENIYDFDIDDIELSNNILLVAKGYSAQVGDMLYISGQIGNIGDDYNEIIEGGIKSQANQAMLNISRVLGQHDAKMENILKCTCMMKSSNDQAMINKIYNNYFDDNKPARITFDEANLRDEILVEIECVAKVR